MYLRLFISFFLLGGSLALATAGTMPEFKMPDVQEPVIPRRTMRVTDFGAVPDGKTLNTDAIKNAIAALEKKGGGRLVFPPGIWLTGPIGLKSKIELHLEEGALIQFTKDIKQYPLWILALKGERETNSLSPIHGENLHDVAITGRGVVDGAGEAWRPVKQSKLTEGQWKELLASGGLVMGTGRQEMWWPAEDRPWIPRPRLVRFLSCRNVLLEGVTFQNSPGWNLNPTLCENVTLRNVTVRNPWYAQNGDGLDVEFCRNVIIRDSHFDVGDDAICLKSGTDEEGRRIGVPTENILIENCTVYHGHGGVTIGSEMSAGVRNVRVNNCLFLGTDLGLRFKSRRGRGGVVEKIFISNVRMIDIPTEAIGFNLYYGGHGPTEPGSGQPTGEAAPAQADESTPQFRDIYIQNVTCRGAKRAIALQGLPEMPIRGIHLRDISITSERGVELTDAADITLDRVEIVNRTGPVVGLNNCRDVRIDGLSYPAGAEVVMHTQGGKNSGIVIKNTDLKAAQKDFTFAEGATRAVVEVK